MRHRIALFGLILALVAAHPTAQGASTSTLRMDGISQPVEILHDRWGIAHIYAQNETDLFFALQRGA